MTSFVLVPGACHGGWWYAPVLDKLAQAGHRAVAVTLSGLDPDARPSNRAVNLSTHLDEAAQALADTADEAGEPVVLVGHSYGGSVITGIADRQPSLVRALVYLDAFVPSDGQSCYAMTDDEQRRWYIEGAARTGLSVAPLPFFDHRARPHPIGTLLQGISLTGGWQSVPVKHYVAAMGWEGASPFAPTTARIEATPGWTLHRWPTRHNVLADGPDRLVELLLAL